MSDLLSAQRAVARILNGPDGGAGVLIVGGFVVTCAHVVNEVCAGLGQPAEPGAVLSIDFPFADIFGVEAKILHLAPEIPYRQRKRDQPSDLAVLEVTEDLGFVIRPQMFETGTSPNRMSFETWGFPVGADNGTPAFGVINGQDAAGWLHAQRKADTEPFIEQGFSGAPVFPESYSQVLGICVVRMDGEVPIARIIPGEQILRWLRAHVSPYPGKDPFRAIHASLYSVHADFAVDLQEQVFERGLVALIGPARTGRTSLLRAGLAQMEDRRRFGHVALADTIEDVPNALERACARALKCNWDGASPEKLRNDLDRIAQKDKGLLLIIEALERFATDSLLADTRRFLRHIAAITQSYQTGGPRVGVILVVDQEQRSVLDELLPNGIAPEAECAMAELGWQDIRSAIIRPAEVFGARFAPNLIRRIWNEYKWEHAGLLELGVSLRKMWLASAGSDFISERTFPGFGIELALASAANDQRLREQEEREERQLLQLRILQEERFDRPSETRASQPISKNRLVELRKVAEECESCLMSPRRIDARLKLEELRSDLLDALEQSATDPNLVEEGLRLAGALFWYWNLNAEFAQGIEHLERLLAAADLERPSVLFAKASYASGTLSFLGGDMRQARLRLTQSIREWRKLMIRGSTDAERWLAYALIVLGRADDHLPRARRREERAVDLMGVLNDSWGLALALNDLGFVIAASGEYELACDYYGRSVNAWTVLRDLWGLQLALVNYGAWAIEANDFDLADQALRRAFQIHQRVGDRWELPNTIRYRAELALKRGQIRTALKGFRQSMSLAQDLGRRQIMASNLLGIARCIAALKTTQHKLPFAARFLAAWETAVKQNQFPITAVQVRAANELRKVLVSSLKPQVLDTYFQEGLKLDWAELVEQARNEDFR